MIGNKAIVEEVGRGKMKNGQDYFNKQVIVMEFSAETGKITQVRVYASVVTIVHPDTCGSG